jgi:hypothetical protein
MTPPPWVDEFIGVVAAARPLIDTAQVAGLTSNKVLESLRPGLADLHVPPSARQAWPGGVVFASQSADA